MKDLNQEKRQEELRGRYKKSAQQDLILILLVIEISFILALGIVKMAQARIDEWSVKSCRDYGDCEEVKDYFESNGKEVLYRNYEQMSRDN